MYIASKAANISFAISKVTISLTDKKIIAAERPANDAAMPATAMSVLLFGMVCVGSLSMISAG